MVKQSSDLCANCTHDRSFHKTRRPLDVKSFEYLRYLEDKMEKKEHMSMEELDFMWELQKRDPTSTACRWMSISFSQPEDEDGNPLPQLLEKTSKTNCNCEKFVELEEIIEKVDTT